MQLAEIFDSLINSPDLSLTLDVPNMKILETLKQDLSNYKHRHKKEYENILGDFRLRYSTITGSDTLRLKIEVDLDDQTKFYEGVTIHGN